MSRLEDAEKRLHDAISRLEASIATQAGEASRTSALEDELTARIASAEAERDAMEKRMNTAAVRLDATIERLRAALNQ